MPLIKRILITAGAIIPGLVFLLSGISKLFPIHLFELQFVYDGLAGWKTAPYIARTFIITEIILGISWILRIYIKSITYLTSQVLLLLFSVYLIYTIISKGDSGNCGCFGALIPMTPLQALLKNAALIVICRWSSKLNIYSWRFGPQWIPGLSTLIITTTLVSVLFPIWYWQDVNPEVKKRIPFDFAEKVTFSDHHTVNLGVGKKLIAVLNIGCSHCREVGYKLNIWQQNNPGQKIYFILIGDSEELNEFKDETHFKYPYKIYDLYEFIQSHKDSTWPWIILVNNGIIEKQWIYQSFDVNNFHP